MILAFLLYNLVFILLLFVNFVIIFKGGFQDTLYHRIFDRFDIVYNWHLSLYLWDRHAAIDETISARIRRYLSSPDNWRYHLAKPFAKLLNAVDKGHCV